MRNVSDDYLVAITSPTEQTVFNAEFEFIPPGAREGMTLSSVGFGRLWGSRLNQLNNRTYGMGAKWNSLELNRSVLGGGGEYIDPADKRQTGDWSMTQSGADGKFFTPTYITQILDKPYDLVGIQVIFDDLGEEWATEIEVLYYGSTGALLISRVFTNNKAIALINFSYNAVKSVRINFNKWSLPRRFAKVCQVIPGQIRFFNDGNTFSFVLKEKISPFTSLTIPEYTLTFSNEDQEYNIINPQGVVSKLRELMEIKSSIGLITSAGIEHISTGDFLLYSWPDSANDETAAFNCRPDFGFAENNFVRSDGASTVASVAMKISNQASIKTPISVDSSLQNVQVVERIERDTSLQSALSQLAIAAGGYIKFERDGTYSLKPSLFSATPKRTLTYDDVWEKPDVKQAPVIHGVTVKHIDYVQDFESGENRLEAVDTFIPSGSATGRNVDVISNFIINKSEAERIGALALAFYNHRLTFNIEYRGDMSIEAGDVIAVETDYGFHNVLVLEHEIRYDAINHLQGRIVGVGLDN